MTRNIVSIKPSYSCFVRFTGISFNNFDLKIKLVLKIVTSASFPLLPSPFGYAIETQKPKKTTYTNKSWLKKYLLQS